MTGLFKDLVPLSLGQGINTKTDVKQLMVGQLRKAENVVFETLNALRKRNGYDLQELRTTVGTLLTDGQSLTKFDHELCLFTDTNLYGFSDALNRFQDRGLVYSVMPTSVPVLNNGYNHDGLDGIFVSNLKVIVAHNTNTNELVYSVQDIETNSLVVSNQNVATGSRIEVANIQNFVYIIYTAGANISYRRFNILTPQFLELPVAIAADVDTAAPTLDSISVGDKIVVSYNSTAGANKVKLFGILSDGSLTSIVGITTSDATQALDLSYDSSNRIIIMFASTTQLRYAIYAYTLTSTLLPSTLVEANPNVINVTSLETSPGLWVTYYEITAPDPSNHYIKQVTVNLAGSVGSPTVFLRSVGLSSKAFEQADLRYIPIVFTSTLQSTYFVADQVGVIVSKFSVGLGGGFISTGSLPKTTRIDDASWLIVSQIKGRTVTDNGSFYSLLGVNTTQLNFMPADPFQTATLGKNMHISGGLLQMYDGDVVVEHGYNVYPETITAGLPTTAVQGSLAPGNYGYKAIYSWTDNQGQEHRSAPSINLNSVVAASKAPEGEMPTVAPITITSLLSGAYNNGNTFTVTIAAPAANPTNTILATTSGTPAATVLTITPNNGTNNSGVPVTLTTAEVVSLINTGLVTGKVITLTDANFLLFDVNSAGGSAVDVVLGSYLATLAGGYGVAPSGTLSTTVPVVVYSRTVGTTKNGVMFTLQVLAAAANPTNTILAVYTGTATNITLTITPNNGTNNGAVPVNLTTAELAQFLSVGAVTGKTVTITDAGSLRLDLRATGGGPQNLANGGEGDGLATGLSGGLFVNTQQIGVPTLRITSKEAVIIELYRTENNGTTYYKVSSTAAPTFNDKTVDAVTFTDTVSDADLISRQLLYTTGGVLENIGAPALSTVAVHTASNRLFAVGENVNEILYSKIQQSGEPVAWNDSLRRPLDPVGGPIVVFASMDEKMIIFESDAIFYISGLGPNNLGQQDTFTEPERISTEIGCIEPRSVVLVQNGLMFKSRKGIYLLNRSLGLEYIGAPVEFFNDLNITSAKVVGELNQVRFTTSDGSCLVYNYFVGLWATFTNHQALSAEVIGNDYYYLRNGSEIFKENRESFSDNGVPISILIETGWFNFAKIQGFMRAYKIMLLGDYKSEHNLRVQVGYDFNEGYVQEKIINPQNFIDITPYGGYSPYGEPPEVPYGGDGNVYQARIDLARQKCESFKVRIQDQQATAGEGLRLSAMSLEVGTKKGLNKVSNSRKFGTGP